ncbi:MAG: cytochrome d ubiquinol oxidase subunit II [Hyphomicrobiales bacterium]
MATFIGIDLPTWWFLLIGAVFSGYAVLDGFDLGAGALHLFIRDNTHRKMALKAIGPVWDGNEVWLVIGGGALFAGFPNAYASVFSAFYIPFILFLVFIIFRAISIEFRDKEPWKWWRDFWDFCYFLSSLLISLALGLVFGNIIYGIAIDSQGEFQGSWLAFINPFSILIAITTLVLFMMHGANYLALKTKGHLFLHTERFLRNTTALFVIFYIISSLVALIYVPQITGRFIRQPILFVVGIIALLTVLNVIRLVIKKSYYWSFIFSGITICLLLILVAIGIYPNLVFSNIDGVTGLNIYQAASSDKSLTIMLIFAAIGVPLVVIYTIFVFYTFRGRVSEKDLGY